MKLYFNGCSHTYGDDLEDKTQAWPYVIAKDHNCDLLNDSVSGGSNDRIVYQTIKNSPYYDKFYIAWTYISRFTRYRADNNYEVNFNVQLTNSLYGKSYEFTEYGKLHYAFWYNELFAFKIWLQQIILLQRFFNSINKPYIMVNSTNNNIDKWTVDNVNFNSSVCSLLCFDYMNDHQLAAECQEIQTLINMIDFNNFVGWNTWWLTKNNNNCSVGPTGHLLEDGHRSIAKHILKYDPN